MIILERGARTVRRGRAPRQGSESPVAGGIAGARSIADQEGFGLVAVDHRRSDPDVILGGAIDRLRRLRPARRIIEREIDIGVAQRHRSRIVRAVDEMGTARCRSRRTVLLIAGA